MSWLFEDKNEIQRYEIVRKNDRKLLSGILTERSNGSKNGFFCELLSQMEQNKMQPYIITLSDNIVGYNVYIHNSESFIYVLHGLFELSIEKRQLVLKEGDCIYLDASLEHRFRSKEGTKVTLLVVKMTDT